MAQDRGDIARVAEGLAEQLIIANGGAKALYFKVVEDSAEIVTGSGREDITAQCAFQR